MIVACACGQLVMLWQSTCEAGVGRERGRCKPSRFIKSFMSLSQIESLETHESFSENKKIGSFGLSQKHSARHRLFLSWAANAT